MSEFKDNLLKSVEMCAESYKTFTFENKETDTQVLVKDNIIAWRGSQSLKDWMTDFDIHKHDTSYGEVHGGFLEAYESIKDILPRDKKIIITGHSLGGGLAVMNGLDFLENGIDVEAIYTFGQPRCVDIKTAAKMRVKYKNKFYRVVHNNDIVPRVPPRALDFGHFGKLLYFNRNKKFKPNANWARIKIDRIIGRIEGRIEQIFDVKTDGVKDHLIGKYDKCINNI